jgi:hypothetical protein
MEHPEETFIHKYVFSLDHKVIGLQYMITSLVFLLIGFSLVLLMRWQLAYPGQPIPLIGRFLPDFIAAGGIMHPAAYNTLGAMHGTIMIFLGIVPLGVGAFGNYILPLQIGAKDMAFPRINMLSYWLIPIAAVIMLSSFFVEGGAGAAGWTSYPPVAGPGADQTSPRSRRCLPRRPPTRPPASTSSRRRGAARCPNQALSARDRASGRVALPGRRRRENASWCSIHGVPLPTSRSSTESAP